MKYIHILILFACSFINVSCDDNEDYSNIELKNYLKALITETTLLTDSASEGIEEGEYNSGAQNTYQLTLDKAISVYNNVETSQALIDVAYVDLIEAGEAYFDEMVPFTSALVQNLVEANFLYNNTEEGVEEGQVEVGSKVTFKAAIDKAQAFIDAGGITQTLLNAEALEFREATFVYEAAIIGAFKVPVGNFSFEDPGMSTNDFSLIPDWNFVGKEKPWVSGASQGVDQMGVATSLPITTDGDYAAFIGNYTGGFWQKLNEGVRPGSTYAINFDASIKESKTDSKELDYETFILSRV